MDKLKNGFVMYDTYIQAAEMLSDADFKEFILKIRDYALYGIDEPSQNPYLNGLMVMVKVGLDSTEQRRLKCVENGKKGAEFGKLGGRPRKDKTKTETPIKPQEGDNEKPQETTDEITPNNPQKPLTNPLKEKEERKKEKEERLKDNKDILSISTSTTSNTEKENQEIGKIKNEIVLEDSDNDDLSFKEEMISTSYPNNGKTSNQYYQEVHKKVNQNQPMAGEPKGLPFNLSEYIEKYENKIIPADTFDEFDCKNWSLFNLTNVQQLDRFKLFNHFQETKSTKSI